MSWGACLAARAGIRVRVRVGIRVRAVRELESCGVMSIIRVRAVRELE